MNENQLFYMLLPFFNGDEWDDLRYEGIITVGIVQASLNEHGLIDECDATSRNSSSLQCFLVTITVVATMKF